MEVFAGEAEISKHFDQDLLGNVWAVMSGMSVGCFVCSFQAGMRGEAFDKTYSEHMDLCSSAGFAWEPLLCMLCFLQSFSCTCSNWLRLAINLCRRTKRGGTCVLALCCKSFSAMCLDMYCSEVAACRPSDKHVCSCLGRLGMGGHSR